MTKIFENSNKKKTTDCVYVVSDSQTMKRLEYILTLFISRNTYHIF